jgi:hypothetical protein
VNEFEFTIDHLAYIRERQHRRATHAAYRRTTRAGGLHHFRILHEADDSCCAIEPWPATAQRIMQALGDDGESLLWLTGGPE